MTKLFISYSHIDESFKNELDKHLSLLKRDGLVETWNDRKIIPGQKWGEEIDSNLEESDLILLLISSDFLASDYCFDKEMKKAIEMHESGNTTVIPIIIRHCDWQRPPLKNLQALPKEAKPISSWEDKDQAWLDVVKGITNTITSKRSIKPKPAHSTVDFSLKNVSEKHRNWLLDTEVELSHRRVSRVILPDIYVSPNLDNLGADFERSGSLLNENHIASDGMFIIFGEEQSGKTSLAKRAFNLLLSCGYVPVVLEGKKINQSDVYSLALRAFKEQYADVSKDDYDQIAQKALIVDDFSDKKLNHKFTNIFIKNAKKTFKNCIFTSSESYKYVLVDIEGLEGFDYLEICQFGKLKRAALIERWLNLGIEEELDESLLYKKTDELQARLDSLIRKNIIPSKPIFLLSLLQIFEAYTPQNIDLTSYGHCYQYLVYQALEKASIRYNDIDKYLNVMTEFAWAQFINGGVGLDRDQVDTFFLEYENKYLKVNRHQILSDLLHCNILIERDEKLLFKYPYIYYFFSAKRLVENYSTAPDVKNHINKLFKTLHREESANIIIFVSHHTKDDWVLDEIQLCLMELFEEQKNASLDKDSLQFMIDFFENIPSLVIEQRKVEEERQKFNQKLDEIESKNDEIEEKIEKLDPSALLARINKTFKAVEIVGQIVRNRHASLHKAVLRDIIYEGLSTMLRFLDYFLNLSEIVQEEVTKHIEYALAKNPLMPDKNIEKIAKNMFCFLTYKAILGVLLKTSSALGSIEAEEIYNDLENEIKTPAIMLVNQAIQLQFHKNLNLSHIEKLDNIFKKNPTCSRILREIVIQHIYMFPVDYKVKQRIANKLKISMAKQRLLDLDKRKKI
jgi:hypothetical protein